MADQPPNTIDAYAPKEIAHRVETAGVAKAGLPLRSTLVLAILAGVHISFGAMFFELVITDSGLGFGPNRLRGGVCFSLGLVLVVVGGAELFTGNNLIVMAWASRLISTSALLRNWGLVYVGNLIGALAMVLAAHLSGTLELGGGAVAATAVKIAMGKVALDPLQAFVRGILCNALVCLAIWLCFAAHTVAGKILAILLPISAFVALGFEHSVANMYLIPIGMVNASGSAAEALTVAAFIGNLVPVTLGNIVGGGVFVALVYWIVYGRERQDVE